MSDSSTPAPSSESGLGPGPEPERQSEAEELAERVAGATMACYELLSIYLGDRLGWYRALAAGHGMTGAELAAATVTAERYAREWLEQQAAAGFLTASEDEDAPSRRYGLTTAAAEVLTDPSSLLFSAPLARMVAASAKVLPELLDAYRAGGGVPWDRLGDDARQAQADVNRPWFERALPGALAGVPELQAVLTAPAARIADVGCGAGWSTVSLARSYPSAELDGYDLDAPSIAAARGNAEAAGVGDRVSFEIADAALLEGEDVYDAAFVFEALHDMPHPVEVLTALHRVVRADGAVVIMDEGVDERFASPASEVDRLMYGYSLFVCLPDSMSTPGSAATGTVMRPATLRRYAREAGFRDVEILPISDFGSFRFYRLLH
ncbi:class I SAM-dependent methyltransferase [Planctomonas deserti]|uniref:class I SAM-dependent methyltransferase n=1 Tax=Planctomonas deserti TaxID=2144185 RepID=UPI001F0B9637|nr:class I SAM-dependent methyltransferase [Planctomonas deserti]